MTPIGRVWSRPKGWPTANTRSPVRRVSESTISTWLRLGALICRTAMSVASSAPSSVASNDRPSIRSTR